MDQLRLLPLLAAILMPLLGFSSPPAPELRGSDQEQWQSNPSGYTRKLSGAPRSTVSAPRAAAQTDAELRQQIGGTYMAYGYVSKSITTRYWLKITVKDDNTVRMFNLMDKGTYINGRLDPASRKLIFPRQLLFNDPDYGDFQIVVVDNTNKVYFPNEDLEFAINADGTLQAGEWAAMILEGANTGRASLRYGELLYPAKGTMTDYEQVTDDSIATNSYPIVYIRENPNRILIKNFYNYGADMALTVDSTGKVTIPRTLLATAMTSTGSTKSYYNYTVSSYTSLSNLKLATTTMTATFSGNQIEIPRWALSTGTSTSGIYAVYEKTVLTLPEEFVPFSSKLNLQGSGTAQDPYLIQTAEDLVNLSSAVNFGKGYVVSKKAFTGKHFRQTADIDMGAIANFEPIGVATATTFCGIYDGNGHTIKNLRIDRRANDYAGLFGIIGKEGGVLNLNIDAASVQSTKNKVGIVAGESDGVIRNVHVTNSAIPASNTNVGGLVGNFDGCLENSSFSGTIVGGGFTGGLVGLGWGKIINCDSRADITTNKAAAQIGGVAGSLAADTCLIEGSNFNGYITDRQGNATIGGIAGYFQNGTMRRCLFGGRILATNTTENTTTVAGIAGLFAAGIIADCHNSGWLETPNAQYVGGIVGKMSKRTGSGVDEPVVENCLVTGLWVISPDQWQNEFVGLTMDQLTLRNCYIDSQTSIRGTTEAGKTTAELTSGNPVGTLSADNWIFTPGRYPALKGVATDPSNLASAPFILAAGDNVDAVKNNFTVNTDHNVEWYFLKGGNFLKQGNGLKIEGSNVSLLGDAIACDTLVALHGSELFKAAVLKVLPQVFEGEGTAENPYLIKNRADISKFMNAVDYQGVRYTGAHFRLANDINMGGDIGFIGLSSQGKDRAFNGTFDGAGHKIKNWICDRVRLVNDSVPGSTTAYSLMAGFFLYTGPDAVIKNLTIDSTCSVMAGTNVAALVSQNYGRIENCRNYARVFGMALQIGGLVAYNYEGGVITGCVNGGQIDCGRNMTGGIAGVNRGEVSLCHNTGAVTNDRFTTYSPAMNVLSGAGGIVGYNYGTITNSVNFGNIAGPAQVGGIVGQNKEGATVSNSLSAGVCINFYDPTSLGAITGSELNTTGVPYSNTYFDSQMAATQAVQNAAAEGTTALTTAALTSGTLPEGFDSQIWSAAAGRYPLIRSLAEESTSQFMAASMLNFATDGRTDSRFNMRRTATLSVPAQTSVALKANRLLLSGTTLSVPANARALQDTLLLTCAGISKLIPITAPGRLLAEGDGSETNPWLIRTPADWNSVAEYIADYASPLNEEHFELTSDLNFAGVEFKPWARDGSTMFQGLLHGKSHTVDNINVSYPGTGAAHNYAAMFGIIGLDGLVEDLTIGNGCSFEGYMYTGSVAAQSGGIIRRVINRASKIQGNYTYAGGLAGYALTGARFLNCENFTNVTSKGGQSGGIVGGTSGAHQTGLIADCSNHGAISTDDNSAGGIVGSGRLDVRRCFNDGAITSVKNNCGGIMGYLTYNIVVDSCENRGSVASTGQNAGGIAGYMFSAGTISNSVNHAEVKSGKTHAGGIVGNTYRAGTNILNCSNHGTIAATTTHTGGIAGLLVAGADTVMNYVRNCTNYGVINGGTSYAGGLFGEAKIYTRHSNLRNYGEVNGDFYVGGVFGCLLGQADTVMNVAPVTSKRYTVGGLAGTTSTASTATAEIRNGFNAGAVKTLGTTTSTGYNVGGILGGGNIKLYDVYNIGDLSGYRAVGGIVGLPVKGVNSSLAGLNLGTCVTNAYHVGTITCLDANNANLCGHIIGCSTTALDYTVFTNCYYDAQHGTPATTFPTDTAGTAWLTRNFSASTLGEAWTSVANGTYPVLKAFANDDYARLFASAVELKDAETRHGVSNSFYLRSHSDVEWSSNDFTISGGKGSWNGLSAGTAYQMTARLGQAERHFPLVVQTTTGVTGIDNDAEQPVRIEWYTPAGIRLNAPAEGINIRVSIYADGTRRSERIVNRRQ